MILELVYWILRRVAHSSNASPPNATINFPPSARTYPERALFFPLQGMDDDAFEKKYNTLEVDFIRSQQLFCRDVLKLSPGQRAVISNGRVSAHLHSSPQHPACKSSGGKVFTL